ncbi:MULTISPECIES: M56 family metallopeptidase [Arenibacter]|uniref:M56 family metallopeptidase n=1 Tax=Arenibacter TaxID=178469 RepID=UPI0018648A63|nr:MULTISPECIES: M56 family metallopeptidase [Arenibacter]
MEPILFNQHPEPSGIYLESLPRAETNILPILLWGLYSLGVILFGLKFFGNLRSLLKSIKNNPKQKLGRIHHVLLQELIAPHTFFSYIFFNKKNYKEQNIPQEVFWHEETHAIQKHSFDILLLELLQIVFWFHPLVYWAKHLVKLNHEFLADQAVLKNGASVPNYQNLVLAFSSNAVVPPLANAIHYSSIKKRIVIMKTKTSQKAIWLKGLLLIPLVALLLYSFSTKEILEKIVPTETIKSPIQEDSIIGASESMMREYRSYIDNLPTTDNVIVKLKEHQRIEAIYELMTDEQRGLVNDYRDIVRIPNLNISKTKSIKPSISQFESWKDNNKFAIWIDGLHVSNTVLNQYKLDDIIHFTSSFVYNNARSTKFPQPYQNHLYTKNGFEETYSKHNIKEYNSLLNRYTEELKLFQKQGALDNSELRILKVRLDQLHSRFSSEEMNKYNILPLKSLPVKKTHSLQSGKNQQGASPEDVEEYNKLAKKYNAQPQEKRVVPLKDLKTLEGIYGRMTDSQKKEAQPFPECPPPPPPIPSAPERSIEPSQAIPPPPPPYALPNEEKHSKVLLEAFKKFDKKANAYSKATVAFTKKGEGTLVNLQTLYEETMVLYNGYVELAIKEDLMKPTRTKSTTKKEERKIEPKKANLKEIENNTSEQDEKVEEDNMPSPTLKGSTHQKIKTAKEPSVYYGHLYTVPQPPPQKNTDPVEYIKELAEKGATFYIGPHQYKTDEAIELVRKSKDPSIDVSDYPIVRLGGC